MEKSPTIDTAVFGGGCFWCTEAIFQELKGVVSVVSGYAGGATERPTYGQVSSGKSGHAEVVNVSYNPSLISYRDLLEVFFAAHDPTTPDQQGNDVGNQYRSLILYQNDSQKQQAEEYIKRLSVSGEYTAPIVTQLRPLEVFYPAEAYHQDFFIRNAEHPYCEIVINPKLERVRQKFTKLLK